MFTKMLEQEDYGKKKGHKKSEGDGGSSLNVQIVTKRGF